MKSLFRSRATLGLVASAVISLWLGQGLKALALPAEQVLEKLRTVPVFTVADEQGAPLVASGENEAKVAGVFISQQDAQEFVERLQSQNPELGGKVRVVPVSLGEVYQLAQANEEQEDGLNFAYVPMQEEVEEARAVLSENGQEYAGGVPLFAAKAGDEEVYLTIEQNDQEIIPFFFEKEQLQQMVEVFRQSNPEMASSVTIEVVPLEGVINTLETSDNEALQRIMLVPSQESQEFLLQNLPNPSEQNGETPEN